MIDIGDKKLKLSLMMIVKDETECLKNSLFSVAQYVDEIVVGWNGTNPETEKILKEFNCIIHKYIWKDDFADARNFVLEKSSGDLLMWLDADDLVINAENMVSACQQAFIDPNCGALWTNWHYDHDENGNCVMELWRERIVRRDMFHWVSRWHETLIQTVDCQHTACDAFYIKHTATSEQINISAERNLKIAVMQYNKEHDEKNVDAKTVYDLARSLNATGHYEKALEIFLEYVQVSGWDNERAIAWGRMADIHRKFKRWDKAIHCDLMVMNLKPTWPDAYIGLSSTYFCMERWEEVTTLLSFAMMLKPPYGAMPCDPMFYKAKPLMLMQFAFFQQGNFPMALATAEKALGYYPKNEHLLSMVKNCHEVMAQEKTTRNLIELKKELEAKDEKEKLKNLVQALPDYVKTHPSFVRLKNKFFGVNKPKRVAIYCGNTAETWSPKSVGYGVGGSEEAVINLTAELAKMGWNIEVFCDCDFPGIYGGVEYKNTWEYDKSVKYDIFVAWRVSNYLDIAPMSGEKRFLWLHDFSKMEYFNQKRLDTVDKIFVLSNYHRNNLPLIPDKKFYITSNGIDIKHFPLNSFKIKNKCIYASSPDRGLDILLELWPEIIKEIPDATLDIYYGFTKTFDDRYKDNQGMMKFKMEMMEKMKQKGITYYGMVGHEELAKAYLASEWWLYPTHFTEISCITAMKAQAAGCYPITTDLAALDETVQYGVKIKGNINEETVKGEYLKTVLEKIKAGYPADDCKAMSNWALNKFDWSNIAKDWNRLFLEVK